MYMADWFKLHENWFTEPRLQWAIKDQPNVVQTWLWCLTECCRTKSDTIGLHSEDYEMLGIQQLLNISPGIFNSALKLLAKIKYIEIDEAAKTIKVLKWNDFQSDYLRKKDHRDSPTKSDIVRQSPTSSDGVVLEEKREDKKRRESIAKEGVKIGGKLVSSRFKAPSPSEVEGFAAENGGKIDGETFCNHYAVEGWKRNGKKIVDWKPLVLIWLSRDKAKHQKPEPELRTRTNWD